MQSQNQMHGGSGSNHQGNSNGKRSLDSLAVPDGLSPPQKRANSEQMPVLSDADAAVERELAALVSQLNSQDQNGQATDLSHPSLGGHDDHASAALLLEQQLEGALATINAAHLELPSQPAQSDSLGEGTSAGTNTDSQQSSLPAPEPAPEPASAEPAEPVPEPEPPRQSENYLDELQKQILEAVAESVDQQPQQQQQEQQQQQQEQAQPQPEQDAASAPTTTQQETAAESSADLPLLGNDPVVRQARKHSAGALNLVAAQVLTLLSQGYYQEVLNLVTQPDSERGKVYYTLVDALENLKRLYLPKTGAFIPAEIPDLPEFKELSVITHRANLATFCAACFGTIEVGFKELNDKVFEILVPHGTRRILKSHIPVILNLKTQAYIASFDSTEKSREEILNELFPPDISEQLSAMHPDRPDLSPSETDYVNRSQRRRENLIKEESQETLAKEYQWVYFLRELSEYIMKTHDLKSIFEAPMPAGMGAETEGKAAQTESGSSDANAQAESSTSGAAETPTGVSKPVTTASKPRATPKKPRKKATKPAAAAASAATSATATGNNAESDTQSKEGEKDDSKQGGKDGTPEGKESGGKDKPKVAEPSDDSLRVYEAARSKASSEGIDVVRQIKTANLTRRSWTKEEEEALMKGLDRVQGPYWAQILELYGLGGSISEVLKDRNQVQLKDKARNLKMLMVRLGLPLPAVFEYVTGDWEARRGRGRRAKDRENAARQKRPVEELESELKAEGASSITAPQPGSADAEIDAAVAQIQEAKARKSRPASGAKNALPQDQQQQQQPPILSMDPHMQQQQQADQQHVPQLHMHQLHQLHQPQDQLHQLHHQLGDQAATEDAAQAVERALGLLQQQDNGDSANHDERQIQHLLQSVGDYING